MTLLFALFACTPPEGPQQQTQEPQEMLPEGDPDCEEVSTADHSDLDTVLEGWTLSPQEHVDLLALGAVGEISDPDGGAHNLNVSLVFEGSAELITREPVDGAEGSCAPLLRMPAQITVDSPLVGFPDAWSYMDITPEETRYAAVTGLDVTTGSAIPAFDAEQVNFLGSVSEGSWSGEVIWFGVENVEGEDQERTELLGEYAGTTPAE